MNRLAERMYSHYEEMTLAAREHQASDLFTWNRLDLGVKSLYLKGRLLSGWTTRLYAAHIKAFTLGAFEEPGSPDKNSLQKFLNAFEDTARSISETGFNSELGRIPLASDGSILNGAHRLSASAHRGIAVSAVQLPETPLTFDWRFFLDRGMPEEMVEAAACQLISVSSVPTFLAILWPKSAGRHEDVAEAFPKQVIRKRVELTRLGLRNLVTESYAGEAWLGASEREFPGAEVKAAEVSGPNNRVTIVVFQADGAGEVLRLKEKLRELLGMGKHSIHITDSNEETRELARLLLAPSGVHFLNFARPNRIKGSRGGLQDLSERLGVRELCSLDVAVDTGGVLELYGIRKARDIDLVVATVPSSLQGTLAVDIHASTSVLHGASEGDLIYDPRLSFIYKGVRYLSLEQVFRFKKARAEPKDLLDIEAIRPYLGQSKVGLVRRLHYRFRYVREKLRMGYRKWKLRNKR